MRALGRAVAAILLLSTASLIAQGAPPRTSRGGPAGARRAEAPVPFRVGETLTYDVSWSNFVSAGTATVAVREKKPSYGSTAYYVVAEGRPNTILSRLYTLYYKADTLIDAYTLGSQRGSVYSQEGRRTRFKATRFNRDARTATYEVRTATVVTRDLEVAADAQDALAAIYALRAMPLAAGRTIEIPVSDSGKTYRVTMAVGRPEQVETALGTVRAWKIVPTVVDDRGQATSAMTVWLSDDARRLPVRLQATLPVGSVNIVLKTARGTAGA